MSESEDKPVQAEYDAIAAHNRIAKFYRYRTQYGDKFFGRLATRLKLGRDTEVLDLCCGTGAVAAGLASFCKAIDAVDGAPEMIAHAFADERITYHVFDIGSPDFAEWIRGRTFA